MKGSAIWGLLLLVGSCIVLADPEAEPSEELFNRLQLPKHRKEDKCYDENGRPQVSLDYLYYLHALSNRKVVPACFTLAV